MTTTQLLRPSRAARFSLVFIILASNGCGDGRPPRVPVSGQVLIDNRPLPNAFVQFCPPHARPSSAKTDQQGRFTLKCYEDADGAAPGIHQLAVSANEPAGPNKTIWYAPKKYADVRTSELQQEITDQVGDVVIHLTWAGGQPFIENEETGQITPYRTGRNNPQ